MADKPILFSGPMVRALLAGSKTQTRRALNPQPDDIIEGDVPRYLRIAVGDRLWVRESGLELKRAPLFKLFAHDASPGRYWTDSDGGRYGASYSEAITRESMIAGGDWRVRPSIHMPRWASRITLTVTDVRVERLQDISEADALAEGIEYVPEGTSVSGALYAIRIANHWSYVGDTAADVYRLLWNGINGAGSWEANPWVAAYTFTVERGNIDQIGRS